MPLTWFFTLETTYLLLQDSKQVIIPSLTSINPLTCIKHGISGLSVHQTPLSISIIDLNQGLSMLLFDRCELDSRVRLRQRLSHYFLERRD